MPEATVPAPNPIEAAAVAPVAAVAATLLSATPAAEITTPATPPAAVDPAATPAVVKPAEPAAAKTEVKVEGAPEKYEFKAPEGKSYDANILTAFEASAKEANLSQDAAQKLLDAMSPKIQERQTEQIAAVNKQWLESSKSDTEFGGVQLDQNLGTAKKALDRFGSPALSQLLGSTGLGNHPEVIRAFYKIGKAISEDTFVSGAAAAKHSANPTAVLYDNTK